MLSKEEFIKYIVDGPQAESQKKTTTDVAESALPEGFDDFGFAAEDETVSPGSDSSSFARNLLIAAGFGNPEHIERSEVILSDDTAAKHLPDLVYYWPKSDERPYQTLLFELVQPGSDVLKTALFKKSGRQQLLEDAMSRFVQHTLRGFEKGGEKRTASVRQGKQTETLCLISVLDDREREAEHTQLVCFGTKNKTYDSLETFHIREEAKFWEPQIREDHLAKLYDRHFKKLASDKWQNAFISKEERKLAHRLLETCIDNKATEHDIEKSVIDLLEEIAGSYGLRRKGGKKGKRLKPFQLPGDHDIGSDPESRTTEHNPFQGMTLRDEKNRLLGYIIYCLDEKQDAEKLRNYLQANNRFHNVLVIYPDGDHAELELWQGKTVLPGKLLKNGANYSGEGEVVNLLSRFFVVSKAKVKNPVELAEELAYRARYLRKLAIKELAENKEEGPLRELYTAFKETLVHDQTEEEFADAFAQTLTYGLLTSRWMGSDKLAQSGERFTRQTALKYLPSTSNFLGELFETALAVKLDDQRGRLLWLVDDIANLLDRIDVIYVFGEGDKDSDQATDPVIHFYEPFLAAYDNELRNKRGVYFTPRPVVSFIVRSVHETLQKEFGLEDGLASTDTWGDMQNRFPDLELPEGVKQDDPFVCILDPATGTGTFLYECIELIEKTMKEKWRKELCANSWDIQEILDRWSIYVSEYLIPRLYGYELMMASYAISHLKLTFKLTETGYSFAENQKLNIYLTNSLEDPTDLQKELEGIFPSLATEAKDVNCLKRTKIYTIVIGNPPYSKSSANRSIEAEKLVQKYKKLATGERNVQPLSDDYVKFLAFAEKTISKVPIGIISMITNRGWLGGLIHRGMRTCMINSFSFINIADCHGDSNIGENQPDGLQNENIFDIQQGVSVCLLTRSTSKSDNIIKYLDLWGNRKDKFSFLIENTIYDHSKELSTMCRKPNFFFLPQEISHIDEYESQLKMTEIFGSGDQKADKGKRYGNGIKSNRDALLISFNKEELLYRMRMMRNPEYSDEDVRKKLNLKDGAYWNTARERKKVQAVKEEDMVKRILYRPFDVRWIWYQPNLIQIGRGGASPTLMHHMMAGENLAILTSRNPQKKEFSSIFVTTLLSEMKTAESTRASYCFPLYVFPRNSMWGNEKEVNLNCKFIYKFSRLLGMSWDPKCSYNNYTDDSFGSTDIFYYIYAQMFSRNYRKRYGQFLMQDFPRIFLTMNKTLFFDMAVIGKDLINLHLMKCLKLNKLITNFSYSNEKIIVEKITYLDETVWIDKKKTVGFSKIPEDVWDFFIGGYQVCHKWLKDRQAKGGKNPVPAHPLSKQDIIHYQKIIVAISETIRLQAEIDKVIDQHGGWPGAFVTSKPEDDA